MSKIVAVPDDLYNQAAKIAAREQVSVEEFVSAAVANQLASREFIESRAKGFNRADFEKALKEIPDVEPEDYDRKWAPKTQPAPPTPPCNKVGRV